METYDLIIIGGGPAGLTAGIYAGRRNLKCMIISETVGGLMSLAHLVENYPGIDAMPGIQMADLMKKQALKFGCEFKGGEVVGLSLDGDVKKVITHDAEYQAMAVIITTGGHNRKLGVEGEEKFLGRGVSYCATCDGPLFKNKRVAIIGGSDCATNVSIYLSEIASEAYLIHRKDQLRAEEANQEKLKKTKIQFIWNSVIEKIEGEKFVKSITIRNTVTNQVTTMPIDGVFIECGEIPTTEIVKLAGVEVNDANFIKVNGKYETNIKGVFAAGVVTGSISQIVIAAGEGAIAATSAYMFLKGDGKASAIDYGAKK
jgi:thioredoxin reductase (NADPH)